MSKLTLRILVVNLVAVAIVAGGVLYLDRYQRGLVGERLEALATQANVVAAALGESAVPPDPTLPQAMDPTRARQIVQRLAPPLRARARLFDRDGRLLADSRLLAIGGAEVQLRELPPPRLPGFIGRWFDRGYDLVEHWLRPDLPRYEEFPDQRAEHYDEVRRALTGSAALSVRMTADGHMLLMAAAPVQRFKQVVGALLMTSDTADIDARVRTVRSDVLTLSVVAFGVTMLLSMYLAGSITRPIRRLAASAERVSRGRGRAEEIPDLSVRGDEIGELSTALKQMTEALWERIDAIEGFAADVAHELKNPLTSLRSAAETVQRVNDAGRRDRLLKMLLDDVRRMDRLISDISAASRLDAELARAEPAPVNLTTLLTTMVEVERARADSERPRLALAADHDSPIHVVGIESRLAQVFRNLIDNAVSFSPPGGEIRLDLGARDGMAEIVIEDQGPGLPATKTRTIFERFYTERPAGEAFGAHSGLGLSIAKQIVEAHGGTLSAENRRAAAADGPQPAGARFTVRLPL